MSMSSITGRWKDGNILLDSAADWPDGCRVVVEPLSEEASTGLSENEWDDSPEAIAEWLQWYEALEPLEISAQEEEDLADWRRQLREYESAQAEKRARSQFE